MIVVAGEALVDLISRADGTVIAVPGGGPYNTARAIARLGERVAWIGGLSDDRFGRELEAGLTADGVALDLVQRSRLPTTLALAELDAGGAATYRFYTAGTSAPAVGAGPLGGGLPATTRALHAGTLGLVLEPMATTVEWLVGTLAPDALLMVDPNCRPSIVPDPDAFRSRVHRVLARADVVKVSTDDLAYLEPGADPMDGARQLVAHGAHAVLVTDGAGPVRVLVAGTVSEVVVPRVEVVDTVGAGDTFGGAVLASLVHDGATRATLGAEALLRAVRFGVRASAIACTRPGADPPTIAELGGWPRGEARRD